MDTHPPNKKEKRTKQIVRLADTNMATNMARTAAKLWENAFQMIPDISFFHVEKKITKMFDKNFRRKEACVKRVC